MFLMYCKINRMLTKALHLLVLLALCVVFMSGENPVSTEYSSKGLINVLSIHSLCGALRRTFHSDTV